MPLLGPSRNATSRPHLISLARPVSATTHLSSSSPHPPSFYQAKPTAKQRYQARSISSCAVLVPPRRSACTRLALLSAAVLPTALRRGIIGCSTAALCCAYPSLSLWRAIMACLKAAGRSRVGPVLKRCMCMSPAVDTSWVRFRKVGATLKPGWWYISPSGSPFTSSVGVCLCYLDLSLHPG